MPLPCSKLRESSVAEWRNWQTHQTQNLAKFTLREGSTPSSATILIINAAFIINTTTPKSAIARG
jgi:hypothetical protein